MARATGGTITTSGSYTIHTFTSSGTFTPDSTLNVVDVLVVAGGGGGGYARTGGGGGGGVIYETDFAVTPSVGISVTVGAGGAGAVNGTSKGSNGANSVFSSLTSIGGGGGAMYETASTGNDGGSGGGGGGINTPPGSRAGGTGTVGQGNNGGAGVGNNVGGWAAGGGGGGAGAVGTDASGPGNSNTTNTPGNGGNGVQNSISGSALYYGGGGGGGGINSSGVNLYGTGGLGGGGNGNVAGTANTGGGGGCGNGDQKSGGSGIVIVRYLTDLPPVVTTTSPATSITSNSAQVSGNVTSEGSQSVTERGIAYGTSTNPTIAGNKVTSGSGSGSFGPVSLTGLTSDTHYYARAYATSTAGTSYGANVEFDTLDAVISGTCTLAGSPVSGAIVTLIDSATDTVVATDTSDVSGNYAFNGLDITKTYHVVAEYEDSPDQYNAKSLPFMSPEEI